MAPETERSSPHSQVGHWSLSWASSEAPLPPPPSRGTGGFALDQRGRSVNLATDIHLRPRLITHWHFHKFPFATPRRGVLTGFLVIKRRPFNFIGIRCWKIGWLWTMHMMCMEEVVTCFKAFILQVTWTVLLLLCSISFEQSCSRSRLSLGTRWTWSRYLQPKYTKIIA